MKKQLKVGDIVMVKGFSPPEWQAKSKRLLNGDSLIINEIGSLGEVVEISGQLVRITANLSHDSGYPKPSLIRLWSFHPNDLELVESKDLKNYDEDFEI